MVRPGSMPRDRVLIHCAGARCRTARPVACVFTGGAGPVTSMIGGKRLGVVDPSSRVVRVVSGKKGPVRWPNGLAGSRASQALEQQVLALQQQTGPTGGGPREFERGAGAG
jgi:hypothetical protein